MLTHFFAWILLYQIATALPYDNYENEKMNDYDNWSDPFGDERAFYDGWSREDVESGLADAYE